MKFGWEGQREKLKRQMRIPAKQKLEWLQAMLELREARFGKRARKIREKLLKA